MSESELGPGTVQEAKPPLLSIDEVESRALGCALGIASGEIDGTGEQLQSRLNCCAMLLNWVANQRQMALEQAQPTTETSRIVVPGMRPPRRIQ